MEAVPHSKEEKCGHVTDVLVVEELEPLVDVLEHPCVGLNVEGGNVVVEIVCVFEYIELNVGATRPVLDFGLLVTRYKSET